MKFVKPLLYLIIFFAGSSNILGQDVDDLPDEPETKEFKSEKKQPSPEAFQAKLKYKESQKHANNSKIEGVLNIVTKEQLIKEKKKLKQLMNKSTASQMLSREIEVRKHKINEAEKRLGMTENFSTTPTSKKNNY